LPSLCCSSFSPSCRPSLCYSNSQLALWSCHGQPSPLAVRSSATTAVRGFSRMLSLLCHEAAVRLPPAVMWVVGVDWLPLALCLFKPVSNKCPSSAAWWDRHVACFALPISTTELGRRKGMEVKVHVLQPRIRMDCVL
jgi:hypothetical protein